MRQFVAAALLLGFLGACSGGSGGTQATQATRTAPPSLPNPLDFPLQTGARVLSAKNFTQVVNASDSSYNGVLMQGNGTYAGNEVIAASPASFDALRAWLAAQTQKPPGDYTVQTSSSLSDARATVQRYGLDFAAFQHTKGGKPQGLLVLVMDPASVTKKLGFALSLVGQYRNLPDAMKAPIDARIKAQTGFSATELTQPQSPIGIALDAINDFSHSNQRAIVLVSAQKQ